MYIKVKVVAGAKKEFVVKNSLNSYSISVREHAERNLANSRVMELVALGMGVPKGKIRIVSGHHSPSKILSINIPD